jgi:hypothetical protein
MVVLPCLVATPSPFGYRQSNRVALVLVQAFADWDRKLVTRRNSSLGLVEILLDFVDLKNHYRSQAPSGDANRENNSAQS